MAKLERQIYGDFDLVLGKIGEAVMDSGVSASYEDGSDWHCGDMRCAVRVYERYSAIGGNRVSLNITLFGGDGEYRLSAITSGGSQAMLFKINTFGEEAFLEKLEEAVRPFRV